jgi:hypothetical protein
VATVVLLFLGYFAAAPLLALSFQRDVPACCRRDGKHHCDMSIPAEDGAQFKQLSTKCPFFPRPIAVPKTRIHAAPTCSAAFYAQIASHPVIHPQTQSRYRVSLYRSRQKRGPPAVL